MLYAKYGMLPEFNGRDIINIVKTAQTSHLKILQKVITPYFESVDKKFDALENLLNQIDSFINIINSFYSKKESILIFMMDSLSNLKMVVD